MASTVEQPRAEQQAVNDRAAVVSTTILLWLGR